MHIIQDVFILNNLRVLNEGRGGTKMIIEGCFQRADEINNNKRTYPQKILAESVKNLQGSINERMLVGEIDHPEYETVKLSKASHLITGLRMEGKEVVGRAEILSTPAGSVVKSLINDGVKIGISSRGVGTLSENSDGTKTVNEDYKCLTYDIVADPSTRGAFPGLSESTKVQGIVESTMKKTLGEKIFVQMLKSKLDEAKRATGADVADAIESGKFPHSKKGFNLQQQLTTLRGQQGKSRTPPPKKKAAKPSRQDTSIDIGAIVKGLRRLSEEQMKKGGTIRQYPGHRPVPVEDIKAEIARLQQGGAKTSPPKQRKKPAPKSAEISSSVDMAAIVIGLQKLSEDDNLDEGFLKKVAKRVGAAGRRFGARAKRLGSEVAAQAGEELARGGTWPVEDIDATRFKPKPPQHGKGRDIIVKNNSRWQDE